MSAPGLSSAMSPAGTPDRHFRSDIGGLDRAVRRSVADIANRCPSVKIEVTGHTDSRGSADANRELSEQRTRSVVAFLLQRGVAAARITAAGCGDTRPVAANDTEANRGRTAASSLVFSSDSAPPSFLRPAPAPIPGRSDSL
jgi:hypothetical protein